MNPIDVDRHGYDEACDWLYEGNHVVFDALTVLADALSGSGGMAGNDRTGTAWATGYDEAAGQLCDAAGQLCAAIDKAANLTNTSLSNHQAADGASIYAEHAPAGVLVEDPDPAHYGESIEFGAPSALGDNGGGPGWWHWIAGHTKGWLWPNADTDELHRIGSAWRRAGRTIQGADTYTTSAADALGTQRSPEIATATNALGDLGRHCDTIGGAMIDLGSACDDYATMVDEHHHEIEEQLASFIKWSIGLQIAGGIASIFTVGLGEGGAQAGEAAMVARAGSKAASILADLFKIVSESDLALTIAGRLEKTLPALGKFLKAGEQTADLETAALETAERTGLIEELTAKGVKFSEDSIVTIFRDADGRIVFLERGDTNAGLVHIVTEHGGEFAAKGISEAEIPDFLKTALTEGKIVARAKTTRPVYEVMFNGRLRRVAITVGNNGYIVGAHLRSVPK